MIEELWDDHDRFNEAAFAAYLKRMGGGKGQ